MLFPCNTPDTQTIGPQMEVIAHMLFPLTIPPPHIFESAQTVPPVITFAPLIWSEEHIAPATERVHPGVVVPIPTLPYSSIRTFSDAPTLCCCAVYNANPVAVPVVPNSSATA
jgi:hypothetical protein